MLFGIITGPTLEKAREQMALALPYVDGVEWRLDLFSELDLEEIESLVQAWPKLTLFTFRRASEEERRRWLALSPDFFDIDFREENGLIKDFPKTRFILSFHDYERMPEDLEELLNAMREIPAFAYKIAARAHSTLDALRMLVFVSRHEKVIGIAMGEEGLSSRILGPIVGNFIDYTSLGNPTPNLGQIDVRELCSTYRYLKLQNGDPIYALIGDPVCYSISHLTHNCLLDKLELPGVYLKLKVAPEEMDTFYSLAKELPFRGFSVTMPLKNMVKTWLAEPIKGPINTIFIDQGRWTGANTDGWAAAELLSKHIDLENKRCLILGAGGVAYAFALACKKLGGYLMIANRTRERALAIAEEVEAPVYSLDELPEYDILLQATSIGMSPNEDQMPVKEEHLLNGRLVLEAVASPVDTLFLKAARKKGCITIDGRTLFLKQAAAQFQIWVGRLPEETLMDSLLSHQYQKDL